MDVGGLVERQRQLVGSDSPGDVLVRRRLLLGLAVFAALALIVATPNFFRVSGVVAGRPSPRTIKAPHTISFIDTARTELLRRQAAAAADKVYDVDPNAMIRVERNVAGFFAAAGSVSRSGLSPQAKAKALQRSIGVRMPAEVLASAVTLTPAQQERVRERTIQLARTYLVDKITVENLGEKLRSVALSAEDMDLPPAERRLAGEVTARYLEPTYVLNRVETRRAEAKATEAVANVVVRKQQGETIVEEGKLVTATDMLALEQEGLSENLGTKQGIGYALVTLAIVAGTGLYLRRYRPAIYGDIRLLSILAIIIVGFALVVKLMAPFASPFLLPFVAPAIVSCIILGGRVAIITTLVVTVLAFLIVPESALPVIVLMIGSLVAALLLSKIVERRSLFTGSVLAIATIGYLAVSTSFIDGLTLRESLLNGAWGLGGGALGVVLGLVSLPFFESVFQVTTDVRLLELADPGQPLMRELMLKAPGTYNHSMIVGNLAESAAPFVGANPLKARVGAYYHDLGKLKRPAFFIENQVMGHNPHDNTKPHLSCLIVTAHVKDGVDLARRHNISEEIVDIIAQHHGTSCVTYFYQQAKEREGKEAVCEDDFRYGSVKPKTKEAALVMLADAVEAAARTMAKPTPVKLEHLTRKLIRDRLEDGQLDESRLTMGDIEEIVDHYVQVLASIYHSRIEYPDPDLNGLSKGGRRDRQSVQRTG
ncbi:MAG: HDIG domain-containing protein [Actinobacteria bacterium]|nr:MAG: HDIG domain-containing protein [Actinomycetota bacterium]